MGKKKEQTDQEDDRIPHVITAEDLAEIKCYECNTLFRSKGELEEHNIEEHGEADRRRKVDERQTVQ